jgi:hypothetical protein
MSEERKGKTHTEEWKKTQSERVSGENNPSYGQFGALNPNSKAIIATKPDGTQELFGSCIEAARKLEINKNTLCYFLKNGHVSTKGKSKGWRFLYESFLSENC